ncbi:MAG TPA: phosphatase PAP2 family protein [Fimbriimonadaceae bacterium]|nr:phosphatase PAP2 family protein [Fimbriimonadaceae bacterium]
MHGLDVTLFRAFNGLPEWLSPIFLFFSEGNKWWVVRIGLLALFVLFLWKRKYRTPALLAMVSWPIANSVCDALKAGLQWQRPSVELADAVIRVHKLTSFGTASAHSATMMSVAVAFMFYDRALGFVWLAVALLTGLSRIYVGVHYPSQVVLGWLVGAFIAFVVVKTWQAYRCWSDRRRDGSPPPAQ